MIFRRYLSQSLRLLSSYFCHWCRILLPFILFIPLSTFAKKLPSSKNNALRSLVESQADIVVDNSDSKAKMIIFTIHGLGGNASTFCDLKKVLKKDFGNLFITEDIFYSTLSDKDVIAESMQEDKPSNVDLFTLETHEQIVRAFEKHQLDPDTPIAFIAHSQGGLVATNVSRKCFGNRNDKRNCVTNADRPQPKNLKLFFSFGTPFWGSATAAGLVKSGVDFIDQINGLAYGSDTVTQIRRSMLTSYVKDTNGVRQSKPFPDGMKMINIAGDVSDLNFWGKTLHQTELNLYGRVENDIVVSIPSARYDFYYNVENPFTEKMQEGFTNISSTYFPVPYPHTELPFSERTGLACIKDNTDDHSQNTRAKKQKYNRMNFTSYLILLKHFDEFIGNQKSMRYYQTLEKIQNQNRYVDGLRTFLSEVKVKTHPRHNVILTVDEKNYHHYLKVEEVSSMDGSELPEENKKIEKIISSENRILDYNGFFTSVLRGNRTVLTAYHEGRFKKDYAYDPARGTISPAILKYEINYPGFEKKVFYTAFVPTYSSYSEIYLKPSMPVQVGQKQCFEGRLAETKEKGRKLLFDEATSETGQSLALIGSRLRVHNRYVEGPQLKGLPYHSFDRVLVQISDYKTQPSYHMQNDNMKLVQVLRTESEPMFWMNTKDVLILKECK